MPTTPTDDPLANSDRTVGVHAYTVHATDALKREALLFDQIAIPGLDTMKSDSRRTLNELDWLRDIGLVLPLRTFFSEGGVETAVPTPLDVEVVFWAVLHSAEPRMAYPDGYGAEINYGQEAAASRKYSIDLRRQGLNAFPILQTRSQIGTYFHPAPPLIPPLFSKSS